MWYLGGNEPECPDEPGYVLVRQDVATVVNIAFKTIFPGYSLAIWIWMVELRIIPFVYDMDFFFGQVVEVDDVILCALRNSNNRFRVPQYPG